MNAQHLRAALTFVLVFFLLPSPPASGGEGGGDVQDVVYLMGGKPVLMRLHVTIDGKPYRAAWNEFMDDLFKKLDTNKDGGLDKEEALKIPAPTDIFSTGGFGRFGGREPERIRLAPGSSDKISRDELAAFYERNGGAPFQLRTGTAMAGAVRILRADGLDGRSVSPDELNKALFRLLDINKDGKLSRDELLAAEKLLMKMDADDDETVSANEVRGEAARAPATDGTDVFIVADASGSGMQTNNLPFIIVGPKAASTPLAQRLLELYAPKSGKEKPTSLTREQLGVSDASFKVLDTNKDGKLDADELSRFTHRPADIELAVNLTKDGKLRVEAVMGSDAPLARHLTPNKDGTAKLVLGTSQLDLRAERSDAEFSGFRLAGGLDDMVLKMQFSAADTDNNGYLDLEEARRNGFFAGSFKAMDADGDGKLYIKEVLAYVERQKELRSKAALCCVSLAVRDEGKGLFDLFDRNGDGRLSIRELRDLAKQIAVLDTNKDGCIELSEIPRRYALSPQLGPSTPGGFGGAFAVTLDGRFPTPQPSAPTAGPVWFRKMDRNRDGDVSRREFLGTREQFDRIDTDGDGLISLVEAEKFEEEMRKKK